MLNYKVVMLVLLVVIDYYIPSCSCYNMQFHSEIADCGRKVSTTPT